MYKMNKATNPKEVDHLTFDILFLFYKKAEQVKQ